MDFRFILSCTVFLVSAQYLLDHVFINDMSCQSKVNGLNEARGPIIECNDKPHVEIYH